MRAMGRGSTVGVVLVLLTACRSDFDSSDDPTGAGSTGMTGGLTGSSTGASDDGATGGSAGTGGGSGGSSVSTPGSTGTSETGSESTATGGSSVSESTSMTATGSTGSTGATTSTITTAGTTTTAPSTTTAVTTSSSSSTSTAVATTAPATTTTTTSSSSTTPGCQADCGLNQCGLDPVCGTQSCGTCYDVEVCLDYPPYKDCLFVVGHDSKLASGYTVNSGSVLLQQFTVSTGGTLTAYGLIVDDPTPSSIRMVIYEWDQANSAYDGVHSIADTNLTLDADGRAYIPVAGGPLLTPGQYWVGFITQASMPVFAPGASNGTELFYFSHTYGNPFPDDQTFMQYPDRQLNWYIVLDQ